MLWGRYASRASEARYPQLWQGRVFGVCPSVQGPAGLNVYDLSGRGRHGVAVNVTTSTFWARSQGQYAIAFDGTNDYVSAPNLQAFGSGAQLTASAWVKRNAVGVYAELVNKFSGTVAANEDGYLFRWDNNNKLLFTVASSGSYGQYLATNANTSTAWNHVAAVHEFGSTAKTAIYINGVAVGASWSGGGTQVPDADATNYPIIVGAQRYAAVSYNPLAGQMDDVAVFNRLLTPGEIRLLATRRGIAYEARRDIFGEAGFRAYWARRNSQIIGGGV
jgi:hypothetical protein